MRLRSPSLIEVLLILLGLVLIGTGVFQVVKKVINANEVTFDQSSSLIIPTPYALAELSEKIEAGQGTTGNGDSEPGIQVAASAGDYDPDIFGNKTRTAFGLEPAAHQLIEQIIALGKEYPVWLTIPAINLSAPVVPASMRKVIMDGKLVDMWFAPDYEAAGWHTSSALPGERGNLVLSGHNNDKGQVFSNLVDLKPGDLIELTTQKSTRTYMITNRVLFQEVEVGLAQRQENARWISPTDDERITLVTCWPSNSNTHRLIIVAAPK